MEVDVRIADDNTEAAIFFPEPAPGYTIIVNAEQCEELIGILVDVEGTWNRHRCCLAKCLSTMTSEATHLAHGWCASAHQFRSKRPLLSEPLFDGYLTSFGRGELSV